MLPRSSFKPASGHCVLGFIADGRLLQKRLLRSGAGWFLKIANGY
jgi:hypothetical protein